MFEKILGAFIKPKVCSTPPEKNILEKRHIDKAKAENNPQLVLDLLEHVDQMVNKSEERALHFAAKYNYLELAKALFDKKADLNVRDRYNKTPLHVCAMNDSFEVAEFLINKGVDVGDKTNQGETAMHKCAEKDCVRIAKLIHQYRPSQTDELDKSLSSPLSTAVYNGSADMVEFLLDHRKNTDMSPLYALVPMRASSTQIVKAFHDRGYDICKKMKGGHSIASSIFHSAASSGNAELVEYMINNGAKVNAKVELYTPLYLAIEMVEHHPEEALTTIKVLMDSGANPKLKIGNEFLDWGTALEAVEKIKDKELAQKVLDILNKKK